MSRWFGILRGASCYRHYVGEPVQKKFQKERLVCTNCFCFRILINLFFRYFLISIVFLYELSNDQLISLLINLSPR